MHKWDKRFLRLAREISTWSKDPSTQTGAVIINPNKTIVSVGFNGFAKGMIDDPALYLDREIKYSRIIHCEMSAAIIAERNLKGCILYTYPFLSCPRCAVHMVQYGIVECIAPTCPKHLKDRWEENLRISQKYFEEAKVNVRLINVWDEESLD